MDWLRRDGDQHAAEPEKGRSYGECYNRTYEKAAPLLEQESGWSVPFGIV